jgi:uncharacterized protein YqeY
MLRQQLQTDQLAALKSGDKLTLNVLRYIVAQLKYKEIEKKSELNDEEVVATLRKQMKELQEAIDSAKKANREDLIKENEEQIEVIKRYMPAEISDEEIEAEIKKLVESNKPAIEKNAKAIIGIAMGALKAKADPSRIQSALRKLELM